MCSSGLQHSVKEVQIWKMITPDDLTHTWTKENAVKINLRRLLLKIAEPMNIDSVKNFMSVYLYEKSLYQMIS